MHKPIPLLTGLPLLSRTIDMYRDPLGAVHSNERKYGPIWQTRFGRMRLVDLLGPDALEAVLKNRDGQFSSARGWQYFIGHVFPGAIMAMDGEEHRYQRRIMQTAFRKTALQAYLGQMAPTIADGIAQWHPQLGRRRTRRVFPLFKQLTLDLAANVFMGVELGKDAEVLNHAFKATVAASMALVRTPIPGFKMWKGLRGRERLVERFRTLLPAKRNQLTADFFSEFCHAESEEGEKFTDQEVIDHMIFLMMAAHDTTTSTLTTMMYLLARDSAWQERLRDAARAIGTQQLDHDDLPKLEHLGWVMREALRLYPPLASMPRMCVRDFEIYDSLIPAGTLVGLHPVHAHYSPKLWTNPEAFDPERFSPERQEDKSHPFAWVPFGGGAHVCIGRHFAELQVKAVMHQLLLRYRWSVEPGYTMPYQLVPIGKPRDGLPIAFERIA